MTIRLACASTFTFLGLTCSSMAVARTAVFLPVPAIHAPPVKPMPMYTTVVVPAPTNYAAKPAPSVSYAQPLMAVPL